MRGLGADLVHALRHYSRTPFESTIAVAVLAVAMAVLTALVALWSELSLAPRAGFERSGQLISVAHTDGRRRFPLRHQLVERIRSEALTLEGLAGVVALTLYLERGEEHVPALADLVTEGYFADLRPRMQLGRPLHAADHDATAEPVVVISHDFWQSSYDGRPDVLGEVLRVRGPQSTMRQGDAVAEPAGKVREYRVVGVLAPAMRGTLFRGMSLWLPYEPTVDFFYAELPAPREAITMHGVVGRTAAGAGTRTVRNELRARYAGQEALGLPPVFQSRLDVVPGVARDFNQHRNVLRELHLLLAGSALLALVAACNISLFLLSRAPGRRRELAIRLAVGAPMRRLGRQLVTEAAVLVVVAVLLGVQLSLWFSVLVGELAFLQSVDVRDTNPLQWRVLAMVAACAVVLTAVVSLAPVLGLERLGIAAGSRRVTARAGWAQRLAGASQIGIAAVMGGAALAFLWHLAELGRLDPGFSAADVSVIMVSPTSAPERTADPATFVQEREHRRAVIAALPGIEDVAFGSSVPGQMREMGFLPVEPVDGSPRSGDGEDQILAVVQNIDANYLRLLGATLLDGRPPDESNPDEVIVNETLALRTWGRTDVSGEIVPVALSVTFEVAGVVRDIGYGHPAEEPQPVVYMGSSANAVHEWVLVRTTRPAADVRLAVQEKIDAGELDLRLGMVHPVEALWSEVVAPDRARTWLTAASALVVVALAAFGNFGTQRFLVHAGRREYAILAAVGAGPSALGRAVLGRGVKLGLPGVLLGSVLSFITVAWMRGELVSSSVSPLAVTATTAAALIVVLLLAGAGPARAARRTDPGPLLKDD